MIGTFARLVLILTLGLPLAGCDKCGNYFWIDTAAPHSCKEVPAAH